MLFAARIAPFKGRCDSIVCVLICFFFPLILFLSVAAFLATMHTVRCYKQIYFVCTTTLNVGNHYSTKWNQQFSNYGTYYGRGTIPHSILHPITLLCTGLVRLSLSLLAFIHALSSSQFLILSTLNPGSRAFHCCHLLLLFALSIVVLAVVVVIVNSSIMNWGLTHTRTHIQISTVFYSILN